MRTPARDARFPARGVIDGDLAIAKPGCEEGCGGGEGQRGDGAAGEGDFFL